MCELSAADGFVELNENLGDMIKYVANEPSVGLYYIQQHAQNAVPNIVKLKNNISKKSNEVSLHTEDLEDSITMARTMKECGPSVIDEMIRDIKSSLTIMSTKQPKRGVIQQHNSSYQVGSSASSWVPSTWTRSAPDNQNDGEIAGGYFSSVFKSAKEKAVNITWPQGPQLDVKESLPSGSNGSAQAEGTDDLPVSNQVGDEVVEKEYLSSDGKSQLLLPEEKEFDKFKADKEARLEEWLEGTGSVRQDESAEGHGYHLLDSL